MSKFNKLAFAFLLLTLPFSSRADVCVSTDPDYDPIQCAAGGGSGTPATPGAGTEVPIDGGASLLAAAGVSYAVKKLRDKRKANANKAEDATIVA